MAELYARLPSDTWAAEDRATWKAVRRALATLEPAPDRSILDIGCADGAFLSTLQGWRSRYGVELSRSARESAAARGVEVLGESLESIDAGARFTAIVAMDVIEHVLDPLDFLMRARSLLAPGGVIVIVTGASESLSFRVLRPWHWYMSLPEHCSLIGLPWLRFAASRLSLEVSLYRRISSVPFDAVEYVKQFGRVGAQLAIRSVSRRFGVGAASGIPLIGRAAKWSLPPRFDRAKDHMLAVLGPSVRGVSRGS